eukprot:6457004-Amphidinium_carterae.1
MPLHLYRALEPKVYEEASPLIGPNVSPDRYASYISAARLGYAGGYFTSKGFIAFNTYGNGPPITYIGGTAEMTTQSYRQA